MSDFHSLGKRKSIPRNSSSSSESKSPLDKRQRETDNLESQNEQSEVFEEKPVDSHNEKWKAILHHIQDL